MMQIRYPNITGKTPEERQKQFENYIRYLVDQLNWNPQSKENSLTAKQDLNQYQTSSSGKILELEKKLVDMKSKFSEIAEKMCKAKTGMIYPLAGDSVPDGFLLCDGASYERSEYPELFEVIGTIYGSSNSDSFNVPDLRKRVPVGAGEGYSLGKNGGEETHKLTVDEMPSHTHGPGSLKGYYRSRNNDDSGTAAWGAESYNYSAYDRNGTSGSVVIDSGATGATGGGGNHNNMQPYMVIHYIIATGKNFIKLT